MSITETKYLLIRREIYVNGPKSIMLILDCFLAIISTLYSKKIVRDSVSDKELSTITFSVYNWNRHYLYTFMDFMDSLNDEFMYNRRVPFKVRPNLFSGNLTPINYNVSFNYDFYSYLDSEFIFPNLNTIINHMIKKFSISPSFEYKIKLLKYCKLKYPITVFVEPIQSDRLEKDDTPPPVIEENIVPLKMEARQLKEKNKMLSEMIEHIYHTMVHHDYTRLQSEIYGVYSIYSSTTLESRKRDRDEDSIEEQSSQKSRVESQLERPPTPEYD